MQRHLPQELVDRVLARFPLPIADATSALVSAESLHEERDRVVEVFRAVLRYVALLSLSTRLQHGASPDETPELRDLLELLKRRGLTDGQWVSLVREIFRARGAQAGASPLAEAGQKLGPGGKLSRLFDALVEMRKSETVAHGATGHDEQIDELLSRRMPQLIEVLSGIEPLVTSLRLVQPLAEQGPDGCQRARLFMGCTPPRGRFRRVSLCNGVHMPTGEVLLIDGSGRPVLGLHPLALARRPSPEAHEELFVLDGVTRRGAVFVALPSMAEHVDQALSKPIERALQSGVDDEPAGAEARASARPFRGLESFGPEHAALFFGREEEAQAIANRVRRSPLLTVTGPSGSGKSSLLRAGVLPRLPELRPVLLRPGPDPAASLSRRLALALGEEVDAEAIADGIRRRPEAAAHALMRWAHGRQTPLVLLIDQAEELFTLCTDPSARLSFGRLIGALAMADDAMVRVALVVREDFFARLSTIAPLAQVFTRAVEVVTTPDRQALARTLVQPLRQFGYAFEDEALVDRMLDAAEGEPAALGLLQFCADRLWDARDRRWKRITREAYEALGGVEGALAAHAEKTLRDLTPGQQLAARDILLRLVTAEGTRALSSRAELLAATDRPESAQLVLERLVEARLVVAREGDTSAREASLELVHEALLRHWERLRGWLAEDRDGKRHLDELRRASREWAARGRPKGLLWREELLVEHRLWRRRSRAPITDVEAEFMATSEAEEARLKRLFRGLWVGGFAVVLSLLVVVAAGWREAVEARREAERATRDARSAQLRAEQGRLAAEAGRRELFGKPGEALSLLRAGSDEALQREGARLESLGEASLVLLAEPAAVTQIAFTEGAERVLVTAASGAATFSARDGSHVRAPLPSAAACAALSHRGDLAVGTADRRLLLLRPGEAAARAQTSLDAQPLSVAFSPDGSRVAVATADGRVRVHSAADATPIGLASVCTEAATSLAYSPDGARLLVGSRDRQLRLLDASSLDVRASAGPFDDPPSQVAFSPDGRLSLALTKAHARLFDAATLAPGPQLSTGAQAILSASFSPDGARLLTGATDRAATLYDARSGDQIVTLSGHERAVSRVAFSPDGALAATGSADGVVRVFDVASGSLLRALHGHAAPVSALSFSPDGRTLASGSKADDGLVHLWNLSAGAPCRTLRAHSDDVYAARFSPDGKVLATTSRDHTARLWDAHTGRPLARLLHRERVYAVAFSPLGDLVATGSDDRTARVWDASTGKPVAEMTGHGSYLTALLFSPDGGRLVTGAADRAVRVFEARSGQRLLSLERHEGAIIGLAADRLGARVASIGDDDVVTFWDVLRGRDAGVSEAPTATPEAVASAAGLAAAGSPDGSLSVWDVESGRKLSSLRAHQGAVLSVALSTDGRLLAAGSADQTVSLWDIYSKEPLQRLSGHEGAVLSVAFSPDSRTVASGSADRTVRLWDVATGRPLHVIGGHEDRVRAVSFSPDGTRLSSASLDDTARLCDLTRLPPALDLRLLAGARSNLRVCRSSLAVVPVLPFPASSSVWAPEALCDGKGEGGR